MNNTIAPRLHHPVLPCATLYVVPKMQTGPKVRGNSSLGQGPLSYVDVLKLAAQGRKSSGGKSTILYGFHEASSRDTASNVVMMMMNNDDDVVL